MLIKSSVATLLVVTTLFGFIENVYSLECHTCRSDDLLECALGSGNSIPVETCAIGVTSCYSYIQDGVTHRGCVPPTTGCQGNLCESCTGERCNGNIYPANRLQCVQCTGINCVNALPSPQTCQNYQETDTCYTVFSMDGTQAYRGCSSDNLQSEGQRYCSSNGEQCSKCTGSGCNNQNPILVANQLSCAKCDSLINPNCVNQQNQAAEQCSQIVNGYTDSCYLHVSNGITTRGCLSEKETIKSDCQNSNVCELCPSNNCNLRQIESEQCYVCDSEIDSNCRNSLSPTGMIEICPRTLNGMGCYHYDDGGDIVKRGCISSLIQYEVSMCQQQGSFCKTCTGSNCNDRDSFQHCYTCTSNNNLNCVANATLTSLSICRNYVDECFVHVSGNTVTRGCAKQSPQFDEDCSTDWTKCAKCTDSNCNSQSAGATDYCYTCDSVTDPNCRTNLNDTMVTQCGYSPTPMGCYLFNDGGGDVKRGCVNSLRVEEANMCLGQGQYCKTCSGGLCNQKTTFQQCRACSSVDSVSCIRSPNSFAAVTCRDYMDECYTHVENNIVTRGCLQETTSQQVQSDCSATNSDFCNKCSNGNNCNNQIVDGEFCLTCDSTVDPNCRQNLNFTMRTQCPLAVQPRGCYLFNDGGDIVKRGCVGDLITQEVSMCRQQGQFCKTCIGNDCNEKVTFQQCRVCNSNSSVSCIRSPGSFAAQTCRNYLDECFTHVENNIVTRGCLQQTTTPQVQTDCSTANNDFCEKCSNGNNCNNRIVDGEFCLTCDSNIDPYCRENLNFTMRTQCPLAVRPRGCYLFDDGGNNVKRGCVGDLITQEVSMCRQQGQFCKTCIGNDCNEKVTFQRCRACNSNSSVSCIRSPNSFAATTCRDYMDECYTHVENNIVTRGCLAQTTIPQVVNDCRTANNDFCEKCSNSNSCNNRIVDGEFCLTCDSTNDPNCRQNLNFTMRTQCPLAVQPRGCYLFNDGGDIVKRGCVGDLITQEVSMCRQQGQFCKTCIGNDCNERVAFQQCRVCDSTNSVNCIRSPGSFAAQTCRNYLDQCYTHVENNIVTRGCLQQTTAPQVQSDCSTTNSDFCSTCSNGNNCNNRIVDGEFCLTCDSTVDPYCRQNLNFTMRTQCPLAVQPRGCYLFNDGGDIIKRGCVGDLITQEVSMCRQQGQFCKTCIGNDCNEKVAFQQCRVCNSNSSVSCIRSPGSFAAQTCRNYLDQCYTHVENNIVTRGCLQQTTAPQVQSDCSATNSDFCSTCSNGNNCNNRIVDGEFCLTCDSTVDPYCREHLNFTMRTQCPLAVQPRGCYLFNDGGDTVKRGCVGDLITQEVSMCRQQGQFCKTCIGNDCNEKVTFQRCRACSSVDSVSCIRSPNSFAAITCRSYQDECYTHVENNIVTRGCLAQTTVQQTQTDCRTANNDFCEKCSNGNSCNNRIVDGEFCLTCDSTVDSNCRENLNFTMRTQCPLAVRPRGCYRFDDSGDIIKRGCVGDIIPEEIEMCRRQGQYCKTCIGNDCNERVGMQSCKVCNSTENVDCIRSTHFINSYECANYGDDCFVHVKDDVILRGCLQQQNDPQLQNECDTNTDLCETCHSRGDCNDKVIDGEFCLTCDSEIDSNCRNSFYNISMRTQCKLAVAQMGCYLYNDGGDIVKRGCINDLHVDEKSMCRQEGNFCKTCKGNDCNRQVETTKCYTCDSNTDANCIDPNELTNSKTCSSYLDQCFIRIDGMRVRRGCLAEFAETIGTCTGPMCEVCANGALCNRKNVGQETCYHCDSEIDENCVANINETMSKTCTSSGLNLNRLGCYRYDDSGSIVKRGCLLDLVPGEIQMCQGQGQYCKTCTSNDCNKKIEFQKCYTCNSDNDANCVGNVNGNSLTVCRDYADSCSTIAIEGGRTERGCTSQIMTTTRFHDECSDSGCNSNVYPEDRKVCYQCEGDNCANANTLQICRNYLSADRCFTYVNDIGNVYRGCLSDQTTEKANCQSSGDNCRLCELTGCNNEVALQPAQLSCIECSGTAECSWGYDVTNTVRCTQPVQFSSIESCYTYTYPNGSISRGCTLDRSDLCGADSSLCDQCTANGCNRFNVEKQICKQCKSDVEGEETCADESIDGFNTECAEFMEYGNRGCFTQNQDGVIIRGCGINLSADDRNNCLDDEFESCEYCLGNECNNDTPPSSASLSKAMSVFVIVLSVLLVQKFV